VADTPQPTRVVDIRAKASSEEGSESAIRDQASRGVRSRCEAVR
jgi:hypothetical protein